MHPDPDSLRFFVDRWLSKANTVTNDDGLASFDRFIFTYIPFNTLYNVVAYLRENHASIVAARHWSTGSVPKPYFRTQKNERSRASTLVVDFCGAYLTLSLMQRKSEIQAICDSFGPNKLYLNEFPDGSPDLKLDEQLVQDILRGDHKKLLTLIYMVRCNLFHGGKALSEVQNELLDGCTAVLADVIRVLLTRIERALP